MRFLTFLIILSTFSFAKAQLPSEILNKRSDTLDVLHYDVTLDFREMFQSQLKGEAKVVFKSKMNNIEGISFDLKSLQVDSILNFSGESLSYIHQEELLRVNLSSTLAENEKDSLIVYYSGQPAIDASGFGGFYFQNDYAYNMGVAFEEEPHNYGRVWHPCFDNFVERASYTVTTITLPGYTSYAGGVIIKDSIGENNENIRTWFLGEEIPSYLASVGVSQYTHVEQVYVSPLTNEEIPVVLASKPADTAKMKASFEHLFDAMNAFETRFGPYRWSRVGYTIVPFSGGAMEHATNIMYPLFAINGNLQWETLMAHELCHHWWGNLVTCRTPEDMWINEGISSYSESLFLEHVYGEEEYKKNILTTHLDVLQKAHYSDGGFLPISGVPHNATYGSHTYNKGATMMHNLRTHMGDSLFFKGLQAVQDEYAFKDIDANEFEQTLSQATSYDASYFFTNYIFNPGFNGFEVDSFSVEESQGEFKVKVFVQQKTFEAPELFKNVPLQVSFKGGEILVDEDFLFVEGETAVFEKSLPFEPEFVYLNRDNKLLNAVTGEDFLIGDGVYGNLKEGRMTINAATTEAGDWLRVEHYRVAPDPFVDEDMSEYFVLSPERYWKIDGVLSEGASVNGALPFDGRNSHNGNLDNGLVKEHDGIAFVEDSLVVLYRPDQKSNWSVYPYYSLNSYGNPNDGFCALMLSQINLGEYTFGFRKKTGYSGLDVQNSSNLEVYPNPVKDTFSVKWSSSQKVDKIHVIDTNGKKVQLDKVKGNTAELSSKGWAKGVYLIRLEHKGKLIGQTRIIKE